MNWLKVGRRERNLFHMEVRQEAIKDDTQPHVMTAGDSIQKKKPKH